MLSMFPALFDYSEVAVVLLRIVTGSFFLLFGIRLTRVAWQVEEKSFVVRLIGILYGVAKLCVGILLVFGLFTQIGALLGVVLALLTLSQGLGSATNKSGQQVEFLLLILCISLVFLGPGILAIDFPL